MMLDEPWIHGQAGKDWQTFILAKGMAKILFMGNTHMCKERKEYVKVHTGSTAFHTVKKKHFLHLCTECDKIF